MIGGYICKSRNYRIESVFKDYSKRPQHYKIFQTNNNFAFVFSDLNNKFNNNTYIDDEGIIIIDGFPVIRDIDGYRRFNPFKDINGISLDKFEECINNIVSNVNIISLQCVGDNLLLKMASHRVSCGRIWYIILPDNEGIIFCNDYRPLCNFTEFSIEPISYYSIIKYGSTPDPITIIKNIYCIPVSHYGIYNNEMNTFEILPFFLFEFTESADCNIQNSSELLQSSAEFLESIGSSLLLSGGVDSTLYAHYMHSENKTKAYFLSFGKQDPEIKYAKFAAEKSGVNLDIINMESDEVIEALETCARSYMHPFSSYSTLPTCYLMNEIMKAHTNQIFLIDGTGADGCFSVFDQHKISKLFYYLPPIMQNIERTIFEKVRIWNPESEFFKMIMVHLAKLREKNIYLSHIAISPYDEVFNADIKVSTDDLAKKFNGLLNSCINFEKSINLHYSLNTELDFFNAIKISTMKSYSMCSNPSIEVVYPFMWKDILVEQGKLSWGCKKRGDINKWPLKKMLEKYMPREFIYRKKSGFTPPLREWLRDEEVTRYCKDIIFNENAFIHSIIPTNKLKGMINRVFEYQKVTNYDYYELNFVWAILFTELWLAYNRK